MYAIIIDSTTGEVIEKSVYVLEDGSIVEYELKQNETIMHYDNDLGNPVSHMKKPRWDFDTEEWIDTEPLPPIEPKPEEPSLDNKMEVLEQENKLLKAQVEVLGSVTDFHEELIVEMANKIYG